MCSNYRGITVLSHLGRYSRVLERQLRLIEPWIHEQQCGFRSGCRMVDQLSCPAWGSLAVCPFVVNMCFVDLEKSYNQVPLRVMSWAVLSC